MIKCYKKYIPLYKYIVDKIFETDNKNLFLTEKKIFVLHCNLHGRIEKRRKENSKRKGYINLLA